MFDKEDFLCVEILDGDRIRPPYPNELDAMVEAAERKLKSEIDKINEMRGYFGTPEKTQ